MHLDLSSCTSHLPCHVSVHYLLTDLSGSGQRHTKIDPNAFMEGAGVQLGCGKRLLQ